MIGIIAGNYRQATTWAREGHLQEHKDWFYIGDPDTLRGRRNIIIARVGTYLDDHSGAWHEEVNNNIQFCNMEADV